MMEDNALQLVKKENPLLKKTSIIPGDTVRLPSRGAFYINGELDPEVINGEIMIKPMTVTDEIIMRSPDMLFQGTAIEHVIRRCAPQVLKPLSLLVKDVDFILTHLRKISYGPTMNIKWGCRDEETETCINAYKDKERKPDEYVIPIDSFIRKSKEMSNEDLGNFTVPLQNGLRVKLRPMAFDDFLKMQQRNINDLSIDDIKEMTIEAYASIILQIDDVTDSSMIKEWIREADRPLVDEIDAAMEKISSSSWGVDFDYKIKCKKCGKEKELVTQLNPMYFFMQPSNRETKKK